MNDRLHASKINNLRVNETGARVVEQATRNHGGNRKIKKSGPINPVPTVLVGLLVAGVAAGIVDDHKFKKTPHGRDYFDNGELIRNEELNLETWSADYKYHNEGAEVSDAIEAFKDGEYDYYMKNDGKTEVHKDQQAEVELKEDAPNDYYDTVCVQFGDLVEAELKVNGLIDDNEIGK